MANINISGIKVVNPLPAPSPPVGAIAYANESNIIMYLSMFLIN
jgi:hypothetical protein